MEGTVRALRRAWPDVDIVLLHFPDDASIQAWPEGAPRPTVEAHERVAEHYGLASLDLSAEMAARIHYGEFAWETYGGVHPKDFGQRVLWRSMQRLFSALGMLQPLVQDLQPEPRELPAPIDAGSYEFGGQLEPSAATLQTGWTLDEAWQPPVTEAVRQGFVLRPTLIASDPGAQLELAFEGRAIGIQVVAGHDAGALEWSIDGGPAQTLELFTPWSGSVHLPWFHLLQEGLEPGPHTLTLRSKAGSRANAGTVARIQAFLVERGKP